MRTALMVGNHKMNLGIVKANHLAVQIKDGVLANKLHNQDKVRYGMAVSPVCLLPVIKALRPDKMQYMQENPILVGGQSFYVEVGKTRGAFTGETSIEHLADLYYSDRADFSILGHSETRNIPDYGVKGLALTDGMLNERLLAALKYLNEHPDDISREFLKDFFVIFCVGETLAQNEAGKTMEALKAQFEIGLNGVSEADMGSRIVLAYEPVWAIGTGKSATPEQANDTIAYIRSLVTSGFSREIAEKLLIQYGGSMNPKNVKALMSQPDIDGGLIGGASLKAEDFLTLLMQTSEIYNG